MKLRTHTISVSRLSYIGTFVLLSIFFGFLVVGNISRAHAEDSPKSASEKSDTHFVTFHENGNILTIKTDAETVEEALKRAKIEIDKNDRTEPDLLAEIEAENNKNFDVYIYRARPVVIIDGSTKKYLMSATYDTKSLAMQAGFTIYKGDKIKAKLPENILETGLTETYEIIHGDSTKNEGEKELKTISREKILDIKEVKEPEKIPDFTATPDRATCESWMRAAGIAENDMETAYWIIFKESKCRYNATNASSGAYGIPQALPGRKMASAGTDWETNPITQIRWMIGYVNGRYGGWEGAKAWWLSHHWY